MNKSELDACLLDIFRRQAGVITSEQARAVGMSRRQIEYRLAKGQWCGVQRGVYRHALFEETELMKIWAVILAGNGHVSHWHAARLHGLEPTFGRRKPEVTVRQGVHVVSGDIEVHESTQLATRDLRMIDGLPVSGVERTIMDVAAVEPSQWVLLSLIDCARRKNLTDHAALVACLKRHARRGRDGTVRFRRALEHASVVQTPAIGHESRRAASIIQSAGLPYPFFEEQIFDHSGNFIAQVDLSFEVPLVGFLDGFTYHGARRLQTNKDRSQRQRLRNIGLVVLEFTADQNRFEAGFVMDSARQSYAEAQRRVMLEPSRYRFWTDRRTPTPS